MLRQVEEIAIEVNEDFANQASEVACKLMSFGLKFKDKRHSTMYDDNTRFGNSFNQFWFRPSLNHEKNNN